MMKVSSIRSAAKFRQTALLIDDQATVLDIHTAILKSLKMNLKIVAMTNPIEALEWAKNKQVDLIITDLRMQQMDGLQFIKAINQNSQDTPRHIIVVTVLKDAQVHETLLEAGATAYLTKPVQANKLASIAKSLLEQSNMYYSQGLAT